jgi:hypothetical protein
MKTNLWIYADRNEQTKTAAQIIIFGAETFKRAKTIREFDKLKKIKHDLFNKTIHPKDTNLDEFIIEYLVDCIRFMIFFENYMKAELIIRDYCIHLVDRNYANFKSLAKEQRTRPILLKEIHDIENFIVDKENKIIYHNAIKDKTIGINELLGYDNYRSIYGFESNIIDLLIDLNSYRNRLHFRDALEFQLSDSLLSNLDTLNQFVDKIINERIK